MTPSLLARLSAHALEKYPVKMSTIDEDFPFSGDENSESRAIYLSGLIACYEMLAREIAEEAATEAARSAWFRALVCYVDIDAEGIQEYITGADQRWPIKKTDNEKAG